MSISLPRIRRRQRHREDRTAAGVSKQRSNDRQSPLRVDDVVHKEDWFICDRTLDREDAVEVLALMVSIVLFLLRVVVPHLDHHWSERQPQCSCQVYGEVRDEVGIPRGGHAGDPCRQRRWLPASLNHFAGSIDKLIGKAPSAFTLGDQPSPSRVAPP